MKRLIPVAALMSVLGSAALFAQTAPVSSSLSPEQIVMVRKSVMDLQQGVMGAMKAGVTTKVDVKPFLDGAKGLEASSHVIVPLFPTGTEKIGDTKGKPEIWSDPAGFAKASAAFTAASAKLVTVAEAGDKDAFAAQFAEVGKTCGGCHRQFKEKDLP